MSAASAAAIELRSSSWPRLWPSRLNVASFLLVAPLLVFVLALIVVPTIMLLFRAIEDPVVSQTLPKSANALQHWSAASGPPSETAYASMGEELLRARKSGELGPLASRL